MVKDSIQKLKFQDVANSPIHSLKLSIGGSTFNPSQTWEDCWAATARLPLTEIPSRGRESMPMAGVAMFYSPYVAWQCLAKMARSRIIQGLSSQWVQLLSEWAHRSSINDAFWRCLKMFENAWRCLKMFEDVWKCLKMFEDVWRCLKLLYHLWGPLLQVLRRHIRMGSNMQSLAALAQELPQMCLNDPKCLNEGPKDRRSSLSSTS